MALIINKAESDGRFVKTWNSLKEKLDFYSIPEPNTGCLIWIGSTTHGMYGKVWTPDRGWLLAHRASYEEYVGPIPEGLTLDHLCRLTLCINYYHLEPVTMRENLMRGNAASAINARRTHCKHGHELSGENLYLPPDGKRRCRACGRLACKKWYEAAA